jgi:hypothetical protein
MNLSRKMYFVPIIFVAFLSSQVGIAHADCSAAVTAEYRTVLGRAPDAAGCAYWTNQVNNGMSLTTLHQAFASSAEGNVVPVQAAAPVDTGANAAFVTAQYQSILGRAPDATGLAGWTNQLNSGAMTQAQVKQAISSSAEAQIMPRVTAEYYSVLGRAPDAGGLAFWTAQVNAGLSLDALHQEFLKAAATQGTSQPATGANVGNQYQRGAYAIGATDQGGIVGSGSATSYSNSVGNVVATWTAPPCTIACSGAIPSGATVTNYADGSYSYVDNNRGGITVHASNASTVTPHTQTPTPTPPHTSKPPVTPKQPWYVFDPSQFPFNINISNTNTNTNTNVNTNTVSAPTVAAAPQYQAPTSQPRQQQKSSCTWCSSDNASTHGGSYGGQKGGQNSYGSSNSAYGGTTNRYRGK